MRQWLVVMLAGAVALSACARRAVVSPAPVESASVAERETQTPQPPPRWRQGPLPPAPRNWPTLEAQRAARPAGWSESKLLAPPTRPWPNEPLSEPNPEAEHSGIVCRLDMSRLAKGKGTWTLTVKGDEALSAAHGRPDGRWALPFVYTEKKGVRELELRFDPGVDLLELAVGVVSVVGLPFVLADSQARPVGTARLDLSAEAPWRAVGDAFSATCEPLSRSELEVMAKPHLAEAQAWLDAQREPTVELDEVRPQAISPLPFEHALQAATALVGWADPRVQELLARFAALEEAAARAMSDAVRVRAARAPPLPAPVRSGEVEVLSASLECDRKQLRHLQLSPEHAECHLRLRLRNAGPGVLPLAEFGAKGQSAVFDAGGHNFRIHFVAPTKPRSSPVMPDETVEVFAVLHRAEGAVRPQEPLLLRLASAGPLVVPEAPEPTPIPGTDATVRLGTFSCPRGATRGMECVVPVHFAGSSTRSPPTQLTVYSWCRGAWSGTLFTAEEKARLYDAPVLCAGAPSPWAVRLEPQQRWDYVRLDPSP